MRVLFVSQVFWPDTASVAQHMWDLAEELRAGAHDVHVYSSCYPYENKREKYRRRETHRGVLIDRIVHTGFGKSSTPGRLLDFLTFNAAVLWRLIRLPRDRYHLVVSTTVPPLVSYFVALVAQWKGFRFCYWAMDLQPELAVASGMIRRGSITERILTHVGNQIVRKADLVVALDNYMRNHVVARGAGADRVSLIPLWPVIEKTYVGSRLDNPFRQSNGMGDRIVVMYSGNHAYVHPLDTLLAAAKELSDDDRFLFVFVGGGVRKKDVTEFNESYGLRNIRQLPYEPRENIHNSLAAADLQVVVMGEGQVGFTHPNKIYGALFVGRPVLYIGPTPSHVEDILASLPGNLSVRHGEVHRLAALLREFAARPEDENHGIGSRNRLCATSSYDPVRLKTEMRKAVERLIEVSSR